MNIGAHVRGGGKLVPSLQAGVDIGATSIQVFTQSPRMWKPSQYAPEVLAGFREAQSNHPSVTHTFCHATYLINLASADRELYEKSVVCLTHNLSVARGMGSSGLVLHVGSHLGAGFDDVVRQIADAFARALADADDGADGVADCPILIENAAGAGGTVGRSLEEIQFLIDACNGDDRLGLCIDTQHLWASGIDFSTLAGAEALIRSVSDTVGLDRLRCLHLNDSKIELGGNRDRHANIGEGTIGTAGLASLVGHPAIRDLPLLLEVPGSGDGPRAEDVSAARHVVTAGIELYDGNSQGGESTTSAVTPLRDVDMRVRKQSKVNTSRESKTSDAQFLESEMENLSASAKKSTKQTAKKALTKSLEKSTKKTAKKSTKKSTKKKSTKKLTKKSATKATKKALTKSAKKSAKKKSAKKSAKRK